MTEELENLKRKSERLSALLAVMKAFSQHLDRDALLPIIISEITGTMDADRSTLFLLDERTGEIWSRVAQGETVSEIRFPIGRGITGYVVSKGITLNIEDAYQDSRFNPEVDKRTGYRTRTLLCIPIRNEHGSIMGAIQVLNKKSGVFTAEDEEFLHALGSQVAIALENASLTEQLRKRIDRSEYLLDIMRSFSSELERDRLLPVIMEKITIAMQADRSTLFLLDRKTGELFSRVAQGDNIKEIRFPMNLGVAGYVATTGETLNIKDAYSDSRFNQEVDRMTGYRTNTILCMPVKTSAGEIIGVIQVLNKKGAYFMEEDEALLSALAAQAAVALDNSNLFEEVLDIKNYNESILRDMATGVVTLDEDGRVTTVNPAAERIFAIDAEQTIGLPFDLALHTEANPEFVQSIANSLTLGEKYSGYDLKYILPGNEESVSFNINIVPLKNSKGRSIGQVLVVEDITQEQRMMATLSRYVDRRVAEQLIKDKHSLKLGGVRRKVTILFSDIRDFTTISETATAEEVVELLNDYFARMVRIIFAHGGTLDKFIGDAIMAVFGAPVQHEDDTIRAVQAALDMRLELRAFNAERKANGKFEIQTGIGIGYGEAISGNIGSDQRMDYTVIGDAVNLSSRLEALTKNYNEKIIISGSVYQDVKDFFPCVQLEEVKVKGKTQATAIYGISDDALEYTERRKYKSTDRLSPIVRPSTGKLR
ncbi:MAG TPA: GAF domain-containing protein [Blastocatellia bacterium]|nr:GAF domain-containing protein [Blastocatellia bacterium]